MPTGVAITAAVAAMKLAQRGATIAINPTGYLPSHGEAGEVRPPQGSQAPVRVIESELEVPATPADPTARGQSVVRERADAVLGLEAGVGAGIGVYFAEQFATIFLPDVVKYLPFHAATAVVAVNDSAFGGGGSQTAFGARAGATLLTKLTTTFAVLFMLGALVLAVIGQRGPGSVLSGSTAPRPAPWSTR